MDVNTAFLNKKLTEEIFVTQTEGYIDQEYPCYIRQFRKAPSALEQAPHNLFDIINDYDCKNLCFECSPFDALFYVKRINSCTTLYVDDLLTTRSSLRELFESRRELTKTFSMEGFGKAKVCLALQLYETENLNFLTSS